jgi:hypothetical protein
MKNTSKLVTTLCEIGIFAAVGFVLDELQGIIFKGVFPNGGSIGFAMIAVLIIAYRRGFIPALVTGLIMGLLDIASNAYIVNVFQLFLDYIFPYALVALAALTKPLYDRATSIDKRMLRLQNEYLNQYELIWCAVEESLGTDNYWKRLGFKELFRIPEATFYGLFNKNLVSDNIYRIIDELNHEDNHNKRESGK